MRLIYKGLSLLCLSLALVSFTAPAQAWTVNKLVVFGDSLSDTGNLYNTDTGTPDSPYHVVPTSPPYFHGHFSNGPLWVEYLAQRLGFSVDQNTTIESNNPNFANFAYGGGWAAGSEFSHIAFPFSLADQVAIYTDPSHIDRRLRRNLFTVWAGANDYLFGTADPQTMIQEAVDAIGTQLANLAQRGGKYFLILNLPDLGNSPLGRLGGRDSEISQGLSLITQLHNQYLAMTVQQLQQRYKKKKFILLDVNTLFQQLMDTHMINGEYIEDTQYVCYLGFYFSGTPRAGDIPLCANPDDHVFWDMLHPTTRLHSILADVAYDALTAAGLN